MKEILTLPVAHHGRVSMLVLDDFRRWERHLREDVAVIVNRALPAKRRFHQQLLPLVVEVTVLGTAIDHGHRQNLPFSTTNEMHCYDYHYC